MIIFWFAIVIMLAVAMLALLPALTGRRQLEENDRGAQSLAASRQQQTELQQALASGEIDKNEFETRRDELELKLLADLQSEQNEAVATQSSRAFWPAIITVSVPVIATGLYLTVGNPTMLLTSKSTPVANASPVASADNPPLQQSMVSAIQGLEKRLQDNPEDADGWALLGRSYMSTQQYSQATKALGRLRQLRPDDNDADIQYAGALALAQASFSGEPQTLIDDVLRRSPNFPQALWLAGMAARTQGKLDIALSHWRKLRELTKADVTFSTQINQLITETQNALGNSGSSDGNIAGQPSASQSTPSAVAEVSGPAISVSVELSPDLVKQAPPSATLFIFARAKQGPPMPLAVVRKRVSDLPLTTTLDDTMAMTPALKLSSFEQVEVVARVSNSGGVKVQSGDLEGIVTDVDVAEGASVKLVINKAIP